MPKPRAVIRLLPNKSSLNEKVAEKKLLLESQITEYEHEYSTEI